MGKGNIPKTARIMVWVKDGYGNKFTLGWLDMSWKYNSPIKFEVSLLGGQYTGLPPVELYIEAQYDQKDN